MPDRVRLKICGITRAEDLEVCCALGVDAVGINLWPGSKRAVSRIEAVRLLDAGPSTGPLRIGVFVDASPADVREAFADLRLDAVQLHGDAPIEPYVALGIPYVWVIRGTPDLMTLRVPERAPVWVLLDADVAGYGGTGRATDWQWAARAVRALAPTPVWLAGGITPANAAEAIETVTPAGLDVASGSEISPRRKSPDAIEALVRACHGA